ncbi:MAG: GDSL-type esterase/lipase family protein [Lentisphaeria bacterium]
MDTKTDLHRFDKQIEGLQKQLESNPPKEGGILFYGSSTMAFWRTDHKCYQQMYPLPITNTGFGGATTEETLYYYLRLVFPVKPSVMLYYTGANDLANGYRPSEVIQLTHRLFEWSRQDFPGIKFLIIPIRLSPGIKLDRNQGVLCNKLFSEYAQNHEDTSLVDIHSLMYDSNAKLRTDIYVADMIHHNEKGYEELAAIVKPMLKKLYENKETEK